MFILCIKILALALKNSKAKPYKTKKGNSHLQEQYADNLTIFLEYIEGDEDLNSSNGKSVLKVLDEFYVLSGLGNNKSKTTLSIFWSSLDKSDRA